jgi:phosphate transport system permease protein
MDKNTYSIIGSNKSKETVERLANIIFTICAFIAVLAVLSISLYMIISGTPAIFEVGLKEIIFGTVWRPSGAEPSYGILYVILTSIVGTFMSIIIVKPAVELLAGIPSVVYGLLGILILNPLMYKLESAIFANSPNHQFTGGSNLLSAVIVLAIMILPTVINISESAIRAVAKDYRYTSLALGATQIQTIFKIVLPAAKSGIVTAIVLGVGRAIGEAMAISLVAGNVTNIPFPFNSVRFLTTAVVAEMSYAADTHKDVLFTIGLILFVFIMLINLILNRIMKGGKENAK